jgi:hypothetical protein
MGKYAVPQHTDSLFSPINPKFPLKDLDLNESHEGHSDNRDISEDEETESESGASQSTQENNPNCRRDIIYENTILLTRDLLVLIKLVNAIQTGDWDQIEDILPTLACMFRGAGSNNYSTEILHFLSNIKKVWTQNLRMSPCSLFFLPCLNSYVTEILCEITCL